MARKQKKAPKVTLDFTGVKGKLGLPEGRNRVRVAELSEEEGDKANYLKVILEATDGSGSARVNLSFSKKALWKMYDFLKAIGYEVEKTEMDIDFEDILGEELDIECVNDTYEGKPKTEVVDFLPILDDEEESDEEDDEEEEDNETDEDEDDEDEESDDDDSEEDEDEESDEEDSDLYTAEDIKGLTGKELNALVEEEDLSQKLKAVKPVEARRTAVIKALRKAELLA